MFLFFKYIHFYHHFKTIVNYITKKEAYLASTINLIAVLSSPSITISVNAGMQTKFFPDGATNPLAIAMAFIAWFKAPAPIACISTDPFSLNTLAVLGQSPFL